MKKIIGIVLAVLGFIAVVAGIVVLIINLNQTEPNNIEIVLRSNDGVPYTWTYEIADDNIVKLTDQAQEKLEGTTSTSVNDDDAAEDSASITVKDKFTFQGQAPGETDLKFTFKHNETGKLGATKTYHITVDKRLQSTVTETTSDSTETTE